MAIETVLDCGMGLLSELRSVYRHLRETQKSRYGRSTSFGDLIVDRWERARFYGFGEGTSVYDNVLILGDVSVGANCWIGPNVILDGSGGGLSIGDHCDISAGVHIYTHDTVRRCTSFGQDEIDYSPVKIGSGVYIGPQSVISRGVTIGDRAVVGAMSFVRQDIPMGARAWGVPAKPRSAAVPTPELVSIPE